MEYVINNTIQGCLFINNTARLGGAVFINSTNSLAITIENCTFEDNKAIDEEIHVKLGGIGDFSGDVQGGGVCIQHLPQPLQVTKITFRDSVFVNNKLTYKGLPESTFGGGIFVDATSTIIITSCFFKDNIGAVGGAISIIRKGAIDILSSKFVNNRGGEGGAISIRAIIAVDKEIFVRSCSFTNNSAVYGGAVNVATKFSKIQSIAEILTLKKQFFTNKNFKEYSKVNFL